MYIIFFFADKHTQHYSRFWTWLLIERGVSKKFRKLYMSPSSRTTDYTTALPALTWNLRTLINPLKAELNPIRHLLALAGAHHFVHVSRLRVNGLRSGAVTLPWIWSQLGYRTVSNTENVRNMEPPS